MVLKLIRYSGSLKTPKTVNVSILRNGSKVKDPKKVKVSMEAWKDCIVQFSSPLMYSQFLATKQAGHQALVDN